MASENYEPNLSTNAQHASSSTGILLPSSLSQRSSPESGDLLSTTGGNIPPSSPQVGGGSYHQSRTLGAYASPSDLERGMGGYPAGATTRPEVTQINTANQGLGSGIALPPVPAIYEPPGTQYGSRPRGEHSPQHQLGDPFAGSPSGSPLRHADPNSPRTRSHTASPASASGRPNVNVGGTSQASCANSMH